MDGGGLTRHSTMAMPSSSSMMPFQRPHGGYRGHEECPGCRQLPLAVYLFAVAKGRKEMSPSGFHWSSVGIGGEEWEVLFFDLVVFGSR
jgi:hypothetical protein